MDIILKQKYQFYTVYYSRDGNSYAGNLSVQCQRHVCLARAPLCQVPSQPMETVQEKTKNMKILINK